MSQQQQILVVEIRTVESTFFDTGQLNSMNIYQDSDINFFVSKEIERIKKAIIEAIPHFGNYRHPLLFTVQIVPGNEMDAYLALIENKSGRRRRTK